MTDNASILQCLQDIGIHDISPVDENTWIAQTGLTQLRVQLHSKQLRMEALLAANVVRNKVALWQVMHLNNETLPFGQFYITPDHHIAFGWVVQTDGYYMPWLQLMLRAVVNIGGVYYRKVSQDFNECPFDERDMRANLTHLARNEYALATDETLPSKDAASFMLARVLGEVVGDEQLVRINNYEFGLSLPEAVLNVCLEQLPAQRRSKHGPDWCLRISSDVGVIEGTDDKLWVQLNRLNYQSFMLCYAVRHSGRKPLVHLHTELAPELLAHAQVWQDVIAAHLQASAQLMHSLQNGYRMQSTVNYKLGL